MGPVTSPLDSSDVQELTNYCENKIYNSSEMNTIFMILSTCSENNSQSLPVEMCNTLTNALIPTSTLPLVDWDFIAKETPVMFFTMSFGLDSGSITESLAGYVRSNVANVLNVNEDRVVVEFKTIDGNVRRRRLLQTTPQTQADVWIYKDSRTTHNQSEVNMKNSSELTDLFNRPNGFKEQISLRMNALPILEFASTGNVVTDVIRNPEIPKQFLAEKDSFLGAGWIVLIVVGALLFCVLSFFLYRWWILRQHENDKNEEPESLMKLIQGTRIHL
jgi:hypothetical protein